jgi:hypothetical protein
MALNVPWQDDIVNADALRLSTIPVATAARVKATSN